MAATGQNGDGEGQPLPGAPGGPAPSESEPRETGEGGRDPTPPTLSGPLPVAPSGSESSPGQWVLGHGRFELLRHIGVGGMGVVYAARDRERGEVVALKTLKVLDARTVYRLKKEFRSLLGVSHPNLVRFKEFFAQGDEVFFTMGLVDGVALSHKLKVLRAGLLPREVALRWLRQVAQGLAAIHAAGKVHRDLKPSNVMVRDDGHVVILDFGLSCEIESTQDTRSFGGPVGTPSHAAPEQVLGEPVTPSADWYAFGVILYETLCGRLPFRGNLYEVLAAKIEQPAPEIDADVPADLQDLVRRLLARDPQRRPSLPELLAVLDAHGGGAGEEVAPGEPHMEPSFVGRDGPLAQLEEAFARVSRGSFAWAIVAGPSGMGKTTLAREFLERKQRSHGALVLESKCYEHESIRYNVLDGVFDGLRRHLKSLPAAQLAELVPAQHGAFASVFPALGDLWEAEGAASHWPADPHARRRMAFRALRELLRRLAETSPLVLLLDDLQWGDADSGQLLRALVAPPDPPPMLIVGCTRSDEAAHSACLELLDASDCEPPLRVELLPLSDVDATALLVGMVGPGHDEEIARAVREAQGSPYFLAELARHALTGGDAAQSSLSSVFESRLARLPDAARRVLEVCAVAELPIPPSLALAAAGVAGGGHDCLEVLGEAKLTRGYGVAGSRGIWCYHDRVREAVVDALGEPALREVHRCLAEQLEAQENRQAERLVQHFRGAGMPERASAYAAEAGDQARRALAFARSVHWYEQSLSLGTASELEQRTLRRKLAEVLECAGRAFTATDLYLELARTEPDAHQALELRRRGAGAALAAGLVDEGQRALNDVLAEVGLRVPSSTTASVAGLLYQRGRLRARGLSFTERPASEIDRSQLLKIDAVSVAAAGYMRQDVYTGALYASLELRLALEAGEVSRIGRALCNELLYVANEGEKQQARLRVLMHLAQWLEPRIRDPRIRGFLRASRATTTFLRGRPAEAVPTLASALEQLTPQGTSWELTFTRAMWAVASQWRGQMTASVPILDEWLEDADERRDLRALRMFTVFRAFGQVAQGRPAEARQDVAEMLEKTADAGEDQATYIACHGMALGHCYEGAEAAPFEALLRQYATLARSPQRVSLITRLMCNVYAANCELALSVMGNARATRLRAVERRARAMRREGVEMGHAHEQLALAGVRYLRGHHEEATDALDVAARGFEGCEQPLMASACRHHAGRLRGGEQGRAECASAVEVAREHGVPEPERLFVAWAPAFAI